ncbi:uncharacterized protein [Polyergus mexicanus]|uniref:uncharacterized protein isoform X2 n=1 Tax=Polyergus mexicanus TaxID=615972 RepID=UPI0038B46517
MEVPYNGAPKRPGSPSPLTSPAHSTASRGGLLQSCCGRCYPQRYQPKEQREPVVEHPLQISQDLKKRDSHICDMQALQPLPAPANTANTAPVMTTSGGQPPLPVSETV